MIRRISLAWPTPLGGASPRQVIRLLAVSDERVPSLADARNRQSIEPIDAVLGCGDLEPDYLAFLGDAFHAPLLYVRGNHDRGGAWQAGHDSVPLPLDGHTEAIVGVSVAGLSWPSFSAERAERSEASAWLQAARLYVRARLRRPVPQIVLSHVPPLGAGDVPSDPYHTGFAAYRWLCRRLRPPLWLHGHTTVAAVDHWRSELGPTTLINVTGAALIALEGAAVPSSGPARQAVEKP